MPISLASFFLTFWSNHSLISTTLQKVMLLVKHKRGVQISSPDIGAKFVHFAVESTPVISSITRAYYSVITERFVVVYETRKQNHYKVSFRSFYVWMPFFDLWLTKLPSEDTLSSFSPFVSSVRHFGEKVRNRNWSLIAGINMLGNETDLLSIHSRMIQKPSGILLNYIQSQFCSDWSRESAQQFSAQQVLKHGASAIYIWSGFDKHEHESSRWAPTFLNWFRPMFQVFPTSLG